MVVRVAVDTAVYAADKLYDYRADLPVEPGQRVLVPFGRGNRAVEAMALAVSEHSEKERLKRVTQVLDAAPVVDGYALKLALWMNDRFYCTVYEALRAMLPAGLWYRSTETVSLVQPFIPDASWPLVEHDQRLARGLELLAQSGGGLPLDEWRGVMGQKWQSVLGELTALGLAERSARAKKRLMDKTERVARLAKPADEILAVIDALPRSSRARREVLAFLLNVEAAPVGDLLEFAQASAQTITKLARDGWIEVYRQETQSQAREPHIPEPGALTLNAAQENAYNGIHSILESRRAACALLFGVTGSGKTSVYIKLLLDVVAQGGQAIVLAPEIALTPQLTAVFSTYFGARAAVLHSALGAGERVETWRAIREGRIDVVVGTRSAVFAPLPALRMIIIDEEQEHTYKSENAPRYHARDVAKFRCVQHGALLLLGSATPSLESAYAARKDAYQRFDLPRRYNESALPPVIMADMRHELRNGSDCTVSGPLRAEIEKNLNAGEQTILFLNRRGFHRMVTCPDCGQVRQCPHCSVSLTYHAHNKRLLCHYCGYSEAWAGTCAACGGELRFFGAGTQKVVGDLETLFPGIGVLRMDTDTTSRKGAHQTLLGRFAEERVPILVGTQMIAKGLHLSNVTLVGVISADMSLYVDDYRANERTFDLITQVVGRAGRGGKPGRAVIQTFSTEHPVLLQAAAQDYDGFFENELALREQQGYPPYGEMLMLNLSGTDQDTLLRACLRLRGQIDKAAGALGLKIRVLGPAPATVHRINNRYRYHITLCGPSSPETRRFVATLLRRFPGDRGNKGVALFADLHPNGF